MFALKRMKVACVVCAILPLLFGSCSEKTTPAKPDANLETKEKEQEPREDEIGEDCVAFVRSTKVVSTPSPGADCPGCSSEGSELLAFRQIRVDRISCSATTCEVIVTLHVVFNSVPVGATSGGLTAWIPQEQRLEISHGRIPEGEQVYRVKIIYKPSGEKWRAIEFDRADPQ